MEFEGQARPDDALRLFEQAWNEANDDLGKFIAAHYIARHQHTISAKLKWDKIALEYALRIENDDMKGALPSLYLNVGKCYEDLGEFGIARENYGLAQLYVSFLQDDGYGEMIRAGIEDGLARTNR